MSEPVVLKERDGAIVVTGAGRGFRPGFDALALKNSAAGKGSPPAKGRRMTHAMSIRKPIIGAINGASLLMPRIVGQTRAMDLILSGRKFDAAEAERIGLVNAVLPGDRQLEHAMAYARDLAEYCSRVAMADSKMQVLTDRDVEREATGSISQRVSPALSKSGRHASRTCRHGRLVSVRQMSASCRCVPGTSGSRRHGLRSSDRAPAGPRNGRDVRRGPVRAPGASAFSCT